MFDNLSHYINLASHAIGLDNKKPYTRHRKKYYRPYRNYFATSPGCSDFYRWEILEALGYAQSRTSDKGNRVFHLTRYGLDWLGENLGIHIYDEED